MNSKLTPMNPTYRSIPLQSGQALAVDRHRFARLFITEGEVLLHAPAAWLADTVVLAPPRRVAAPAALTCREIDSITAIGTARIHIEQAASPLEKLKSGWRAVRLAWFHVPRLTRE